MKFFYHNCSSFITEDFIERNMIHTHNASWYSSTKYGGQFVFTSSYEFSLAFLSKFVSLN